MAAKKKSVAGTKKPADQAGQPALPRKHASGADLTSELCNLEVQLRKRKSDLERATADLELAQGAVKTAEGEVTKVQDSIAEALYDLRSGQGRITFPETGEVA